MSIIFSEVLNGILIDVCEKKDKIYLKALDTNNNTPFRKKQIYNNYDMDYVKSSLLKKKNFKVINNDEEGLRVLLVPDNDIILLERDSSYQSTMEDENIQILRKEIDEIKAALFKIEKEKYRSGSSDINDWKEYNQGAIFAKIDISKFQLENTPKIFTSITGLDNHWQVQGSHAIYNPSNLSFEVYIYGPEVSVNYARDKKWTIEYLLIPQ
jgi:hypothetical protein